MDVDFWAARVRGHVPSAQSARLGNSGIMENKGGDEVRTWFPCPFCYVDTEVRVLCTHLQEEHCFDFENAVCPICAANLGKDALGHFTVQHAHSIKRRKKSQKSGFWSNASPNIIKDLRELSSFLGGNSPSGPGSGNEPAADPLLSPFLCTASLTISKDSQKDVAPCVAETSHAESSKPSSPGEADGQDYEEMSQRAVFLRELLLSTLF